jgi:hypothetical protein
MCNLSKFCKPIANIVYVWEWEADMCTPFVFIPIVQLGKVTITVRPAPVYLGIVYPIGIWYFISTIIISFVLIFPILVRSDFVS